jgi:membrane-associated HD superfamily phosphohydrolase
MSIRAVVFFAFIVALLASADKLPSTQFRCDNANVVSYLVRKIINILFMQLITPFGFWIHSFFYFPYFLIILLNFIRMDRLPFPIPLSMTGILIMLAPTAR